MTASLLLLALSLAPDPDVGPPPPPPSVGEREAPAAAEREGKKVLDPRARARAHEGGWPKDGSKSGRPSPPDRNRERWSRLSPEERERLREHYEAIRAKVPPDRWEEIRRHLREAPPERRKEILQRLNRMAGEGREAVHAARWVDQALRSIPPEELARLRELPREKRAEEIARIVEAFRTRWRKDGEAIAREVLLPEEIDWLRSLQPPFRRLNILAGKEPADGKVSPASLERWGALSPEKRRQAAFWLLPPPGSQGAPPLPPESRAGGRAPRDGAPAPDRQSEREGAGRPQPPDQKGSRRSP